MTGPRRGDFVYRLHTPGKVGTVVDETDGKGTIYVAWHDPRTLQSVEVATVEVMTAAEHAEYLQKHPEAAAIEATL